MKIEELSINTIRTLVIDAVQKANSGHPGMPLGCAPLVYRLYTKHLKHNPKNPAWINRDRFVLSAGHASMLLYSILHLTGYNLSLNELKQFRQWGSLTPGHPEFMHTPGVETTSGPLGQGFSIAVGMAIARNFIASKFNKNDLEIHNHRIFALCSDGDLMEGISYEAASLAGHLELDRLVVFYDNNGITIEGKTDLAFSDDVPNRFRALGWHVSTIQDVNNLEEIDNAIETTASVKKPVLIVANSIIGFGSPNKEGKESSHGSPLGTDEVRLTKNRLGWNYTEDFFVPTEVSEHFENLKSAFDNNEKQWTLLLEKYKTEYPLDAEKYLKSMKNQFDIPDFNMLPEFNMGDKNLATRQASGIVLNALSEKCENIIGGSADLAPSNNTSLKKETSLSKSNIGGRNIHFGIREHAMAGILNGMAVYGGVIPFGSTFLVFSDYMRPSIRLAAIMRLPVIYIFTHDSIGLGEDGPTHQPVEQLASLRTIPNLVVIRPADSNETKAALYFAVNSKKSPVAIALTRQTVPLIPEIVSKYEVGLKAGAYIVTDSKDAPEIILMASGSEVQLILKTAEKLTQNGYSVRTVSFPSWELFDIQDNQYKESVLPRNCRVRVAVECGVSQGWTKYTGSEGEILSIDTFGASAPDNVLFKEYGFTVDNIYEKAIQLIKNYK